MLPARIVDALNKEPGIYSARYLGTDTSYDVKNADIIKRNNDNVHNEIIEEAVEALVSLGYTQKEITKIIKSCDITECKTTEDVIKLVLKNI